MTDRLIRTAVPADVPALVALRAEMFRAMGTPPGGHWQPAAHHWFADRIPDPAVHIVVVEVDTQVVACAMAMIRDAAPSPSAPDGRDILISNVCTAPAARRQGHARAALASVLDWARTTGISRLELFASDHGQSLYQDFGFVQTRFPALRARL